MQLVVSIIYFSLIYMVIAKSYQLTYISSGFFQLSHAIVIAISAYIVFWLSIQLSFNIFPSIIVSLFLSSLIGWSLDVILYRSLRKKQKESMEIMIASLGVFVLLQNVISTIWGDRVLSFQNRLDDSIIIINAVYVSHVQIATAAICSLLVIFLWWFSEKTQIGKAIKMISINSITSEVLGVREDNIIGWSYFVGSLSAAFAGILIASNYNLIPKMGFNWLFPAVIVMIIGGMGKMRYMIFGALLLATAQQLSAYFLDSKWMNATAYIILVVFLYFRPFGFSGKKLKKTEV